MASRSVGSHRARTIGDGPSCLRSALEEEPGEVQRVDDIGRLYLVEAAPDDSAQANPQVRVRPPAFEMRFLRVDREVRDRVGTATVGHEAFSEAGSVTRQCSPRSSARSAKSLARSSEKALRGARLLADGRERVAGQRDVTVEALRRGVRRGRNEHAGHDCGQSNHSFRASRSRPQTSSHRRRAEQLRQEGNRRGNQKHLGDEREDHGGRQERSEPR